MTTKHDYTALDALITAAAARHANPLYDGAARSEAERLIAGTSREAVRVIDARLQALRRQGVIEFVRGKGAHWAVVKQEG
jgi:hypothetical protein